MTLPATPAAALAEQERVLALISAAQEAQEEFERTGTREAELRAYTFRQDVDRESLTLAAAHIALLGAYAEALERERWIPVEERLPEAGTPILVWNEDGKNCREATYEPWDDGEYRFCGRSYADVLEVAFWRPFPLLPAQAPASAGGEG
ncbi:DUF551 domain-containing protein [Deinococcus sp. VB343]|uniref:DUF551 domain-containing protein n=1 Tax=Deinococcus sp. VB343 TaxID=3385567 RepID=UPI0039C9BB04